MDMINDTLSIVLINQYITSACLISFSVYNLSIIKLDDFDILDTIKLLLYTITMLTELCFICFSGDYVMHKVNVN